MLQLVPAPHKLLSAHFSKAASHEKLAAFFISRPTIASRARRKIPKHAITSDCHNYHGISVTEKTVFFIYGMPVTTQQLISSHQGTDQKEQ